MTRIVAGVAGGRRLKVPPGETTRPTSDRVREALFSALDAAGAVEGARVLDLYAGSGALGLEAASRGAQQVVLVEAAKPAAATARANVAALGLPGVRVVTDRAERFAASPSAVVDGGWDLVLLDPPYAVATEDVTALLACSRRCWPPAPPSSSSAPPAPPNPAGRTSSTASANGVTGRRRSGSLRCGRDSSGAGVRVPRQLRPPDPRPPRRAAARRGPVRRRARRGRGEPGKRGLFTGPERAELVRRALADSGDPRAGRVVVAEFGDGLLVDHCRRLGAPVVVKGLRSGTDYAYELPMALMNRHLADVETVFLVGDPAYGHVSSSLVKEVARYGGDVSGLVPAAVRAALATRMGEDASDPA